MLCTVYRTLYTEMTLNLLKASPLAVTSNFIAKGLLG